MFFFLIDLKLKDATKILGKKFSSGASVNETASGAKEVFESCLDLQLSKIALLMILCFMYCIGTQVVIQGDFLFELPELLINQFKVRTLAQIILILFVSHSTFCLTGSSLCHFYHRR